MSMRQFKTTQSITNRLEDSLGKYLRDIAAISMISPEKEVELSRLIQAGGRAGEKAKEELVNANLRFVVSVAKQYHTKEIPLQDLIEEGNIGLITAAEKFDETRGFKFISYAIWWIRQSILHALADYGSTIRVPQSQHGVLNKVRRATSDFMQEHQRGPSPEELCEATGLDIDKIEQALQSVSFFDSIDEPIQNGEDEGRQKEETMASNLFVTDRQLDKESMTHDLILVLNSVLNPRERFVIVQNFGIGCQERELQDIGQDMGLSRERVRQIKNNGLAKIKKSKEAELLAKYLGS